MTPERDKLAEIEAEVESLVEVRQRLWAGEGDAVEQKRIADRLARLYEEKRILLAHAGTPAKNKRVKQHAMTEREIERLMVS